LALLYFFLGTYFSENALLPGLVRSDFDEDAAAKTFQSELNIEAKSHPNSMPYAWLAAKFRQLNLDTYTHNFTLNYPLGSGNIKYTGKNVYGILRAPRSSSMEALVLSVPYRPPSSAHPTTVPSVALMMSLAKFFRRKLLIDFKLSNCNRKKLFYTLLCLAKKAGNPDFFPSPNALF
jgi:glycosylphosphatidylinositol transamidase